MSKIWNLPNLLSMFRLVLIIPLGIALWNNENVIAVLLGFLSAITDSLDGYFARRFNKITEFGKKIDPLADKLSVGVIVVILFIQQRIELWFLLLIIGRDLFLLIGGLLVSLKLKWVIPSDRVGKIAVAILGITLIFIMLNLNSVSTYAIIISSIVLIYSLIHYIIRSLYFINKKKNLNNNSSINQ